MDKKSEGKQDRSSRSEDVRPKTGEIIIGIFPGTFAAHVARRFEKEEPISVWYWIFLGALFLTLGCISWMQEH